MKNQLIKLINNGVTLYGLIGDVVHPFIYMDVLDDGFYIDGKYCAGDWFLKTVEVLIKENPSSLLYTESKGQITEFDDNDGIARYKILYFQYPVIPIFMDKNEA